MIPRSPPRTRLQASWNILNYGWCDLFCVLVAHDRTPSRPPPSPPCPRTRPVPGPARLRTKKTPQEVLGPATTQQGRCWPGGMRRSKVGLPGRRRTATGEAAVWARRGGRRRRRQRWSKSFLFRSCMSQGGLCTYTGKSGEGGVCCGRGCYRLVESCLQFVGVRFGRCTRCPWFDSGRERGLAVVG